MISLRPYQNACIAETIKQWTLGVKRQAVSLPVGSGKTVVFSNLIKEFNQHVGIKKTLVLAHRDELLHQSIKSIQRFNPDLRIGLDAGTNA
jgi:ATP-dependent helicase IRC3